jgi:nucleoside-diphosphate-sugar epimerase
MKLCYGDVTDFASVREAVKGVKVVYHLAGILRGSDVSKLRSVNAEGTRNVCRAVEGEKGVRRLLVVSSLSAAGPARSSKPVTEADPCRPVSDYGRTKLEGEEIALSYRRKFPVTVLRPGAVYGPRETDIFAYFKMVRQHLVFIPSLRQKVGFIHVADLLVAILKAAHSRKSAGRTYFVSDGEGHSWQEMAAHIGRALGRSYLTIPVPMGIVKMVAFLGEAAERVTGKATMVNLDKIREAYYPSWVCGTQRIRRELKFAPLFDIRHGIANTAAFYLKAGWLKP